MEFESFYIIVWLVRRGKSFAMLLLFVKSLHFGRHHNVNTAWFLCDFFFTVVKGNIIVRLSSLCLISYLSRIASHNYLKRFQSVFISVLFTHISHHPKLLSLISLRPLHCWCTHLPNLKRYDWSLPLTNYRWALPAQFTLSWRMTMSHSKMKDILNDSPEAQTGQIELVEPLRRHHVVLEWYVTVSQTYVVVTR